MGIECKFTGRRFSMFDDKGRRIELQPGEVIELTETQYQAFQDVFEKLEKEEPREAQKAEVETKTQVEAQTQVKSKASGAGGAKSQK